MRYKLKGSTFGQQIESGAKLKKLYDNNIELMQGKTFEWVKSILLDQTVVIYEGKYWIKGYMYKGTLSSLDVDNNVFQQMLECIDRPRIQKFK